MIHTENSLPVFVFPTQLTFYVKDSNSHRHLITIYNPYDFVVCFHVLCTAPGSYSVMEPQGVIKPRCCVDIAIRLINLRQRQSSYQTSASSLLPGGSTTNQQEQRRGGPQQGRSGGGGRTAPPLTPLTANQHHRSDKFRVYVKRRDKPEVNGYREVVAELHFDRRPQIAQRGQSTGDDDTTSTAEPDSETTAAEFKGWPSRGSDSNGASMAQYPIPASRSGANNRHTWLLVAIAGVCVVCLSAPSEPDPSANHRSPSNLIFPDWFALSATQKLVAAYVLGLITSALLLQH